MACGTMAQSRDSVMLFFGGGKNCQINVRCLEDFLSIYEYLILWPGRSLSACGRSQDRCMCEVNVQYKCTEWGPHSSSSKLLV